MLLSDNIVPWCSVLLLLSVHFNICHVVSAQMLCWSPQLSRVVITASLSNPANLTIPNWPLSSPQHLCPQSCCSVDVDGCFFFSLLFLAQFWVISREGCISYIFVYIYMYICEYVYVCFIYVYTVHTYTFVNICVSHIQWSCMHSQLHSLFETAAYFVIYMFPCLLAFVL